MGWLQYEIASLCGAFKGKLAVAEYISGLITIFLAGIAYFVKPLEGAMNWIPPAIFFISLLIIIAIGISRSSYLDHKKLTTENDDLKKKQKPKIIIQGLEETATIPLEGADRGVRKYKLLVRNRGSEIDKDCLVMINSIHHEGEAFFQYLPITLLTEQSGPEWKGRFNLSPNQEQRINFVSYDETSENRFVEIHCEDLDSPYRQMPPDVTWTITVAAYGARGGSNEHTYDVFVKDRKLEVKEVT